MVQLSRLKNRELSLKKDETTYFGKVIQGFAHAECSYNSNNGTNQQRYYFEVEGTAERIPISSRSVVMKEGGLVLKAR